MTWGLVSVGGATLVGGILGADAAKDAGKEQSKAAEKGIDAELEMFREGQEATAPWRQMGEGALGQLGSIYGVSPVNRVEDPETGEMITEQADQINPYDAFERMNKRLREGYTESPGYTFQLQEANKAAQRAAAAGGMSGSGAEMKELQRIAQGHAASDYSRYENNFNNYTNSLKSMANVGQTTATQGAQMGGNVAANMAQGYRSQGAARASAEIGKANAISGAINNAVGAYGMYQGYNATPSPSYEGGYDAYNSQYGGGGGYNAYGMRPDAGYSMVA